MRCGSARVVRRLRTIHDSLTSSHAMRDTFSAVGRLISRQPIASFLFLAYVWSWLFWVPSVLLYRRGSASFPVWSITIGAYGPTIAALLVTILVEGGDGRRALLRKYLAWQV